MRVLFVNRFYWPETPATGQLLTDLATATARQGHEVTVLTSGLPGQPAVTRHDGVQIQRLCTRPEAANSIGGKARAFFTFAVAASWTLLRQVRRGDIVVVMTDPPLLGIVAVAIAALRSARVVHWIQDIYPEVAIAVTGHLWLRILEPLRNAAWRFGHCVSLSEEMAKVISSSGVPSAQTTVIPNWAPSGLTNVPPDDPAVLDLRRSWNVSGKFVVGYSGNLGRVHDLKPIIAAAGHLREAKEVAFVLVGNGAQRCELEAEVGRMQLENVRFMAPQPRETLGQSLAAADVHLVTLRPGCERFVFPSKLYGILAVGRPVIFVGPPRCELARKVESGNLGWAIDRDNPVAIADTIRNLAGNRGLLAPCQRAAQEFAASHCAEEALRQWQILLNDVHAC